MAIEKFLGLQYALVKGARGIMAQSSGVDQIKADLLQLLLTEPGERVMLPEYGTPLKTLFFEPNDVTLEVEARRIISEAILRWEPRIVIQQIQITSSFDSDDLSRDDTGDELDSILGIKIDFVDPEDISVIEELVLEVPVGG